MEVYRWLDEWSYPDGRQGGTWQAAERKGGLVCLDVRNPPMLVAFPGRPRAHLAGGGQAAAVGRGRAFVVVVILVLLVAPRGPTPRAVAGAIAGAKHEHGRGLPRRRLCKYR